MYQYFWETQAAGLPSLRTPAQIYQYFCAQLGANPGELNLKLKTKPHFRGRVERVFIVPKRAEHFAKLQPVFHAWHAEIEKQRKQRTYVKRRRKALTNNLLMLLSWLYWDYAAWIILWGEYKSLKRTISKEEEIKETLENQYHYLSQVQRQGWFNEMKRTPPMDSALQDMVERLKLKGWKLDKDNALRVMLSPGRLKKSPPPSLIAASMDSKKLLSRLMRIPPSRRTHKDRVLINVIKAETR
jgi:hypothetical protein